MLGGILGGMAYGALGGARGKGPGKQHVGNDAPAGSVASFGAKRVINEVGGEGYVGELSETAERQRSGS